MATNPFDYANRFNRARREQSIQPTADPVAAEIERMREDEIRADLDHAPPPDKLAHETRVARDAGVQPYEIADVNDAQDALHTRQFLDLTKRYPAMGKFAIANPRGAATARDDAKSLGMFGEAWDFLKKLPARLGAGTIDTTAGLFEDIGSMVTGPGVLGEVQKQILNTAGRSFANTLRPEAQRIRQANQGRGFVSESVLSGMEYVPAAIAAAATRNPEFATTMLGLSVRGQALAEGRAQGLTGNKLEAYGALQGGIEFATERMPVGTLVDMIVKRTPWGKAFVRELGQEMIGEQVATFLQDLTDWAMLPENESKPFSKFLAERPRAAAQTAIGVAAGAGATTGVIHAAQRATDATVRVSRGIQDSVQAKREARFFDKAEKAAGGSKLKERDPEAFRDLMRRQAEDAGARNVFIPADAIREFKQSDSYDPDADPFSGADWDEADATGGDYVMPVEDALTDLVGTPAWDAVKDHARLTPGGMSAAEAADFDTAMADVMAGFADRQAAQDKADAASKSVREKLVDQVAQKFGVSFTSPAARNIAELAVARAQTRADRLGQPLQGDEFDNLDVRQVLPEGVAEAVKADTLDLVINAMRKGAPAEQGVGPSLLEFIASRGGVNDTGGDLRSMGVPSKYLRDFDPRQGAIGGISGAGDYGIDTTLRAAIEHGFFPELSQAEAGAEPSQLDTQVLLDAIAEEVAGRPMYAETRTDPMRASADDLRQVLSEQGYSPDAMSDADIRAAVERMDAAGAEGRALQQSDMSDAAHGQIRFDQDRRIIELFQSRNLSTPIHELGHMWLEELLFDASLPEAPDQVKTDAQTVKDWFAANGHPIGDNGMIPTEAHELFARGVETYVMEGKAPSPALTRLFETLRQWMVNIYKTVARLKAPITPEIREVFDRMLATDEEIAQARERQALGELFKDASSIGMGEAEFTAYRQLVDDARAGAHAALLDKTMATIRRRETERYREYRKAIRKDEQERIDASPLFRAQALMKDQRISKAWIEDRMGLDALDMLPKRVPPLYRDGGADPEAIAEMAGYASATEMIEALIGAERAHRQAKEGGDQRSMRERAIETATDREFERRYGDPLNDGSIEREALAAVHSEMQGEVIATELRVLARKTGQRPTPYRIARDWARGKIRSGIVVDEASASAIQRYARNAAKAGRAAEQAMLKQDVDETFRQKQFQMVNSALLAEAKEARDEVEAAVKRMDKIARAKTRKSVDQDYLEQAQALLEAVDLRRRSQVGIDRKGQWEAWASEREAEGYDVVVPPSFEAQLGSTNWTRLSVESLLALDEAVKQVMHLGRLKQTLIDRAEEREWEEIVGEAEANADGIGRKPPTGSFTEPGWWDSIKARAATMDAALLKMEQVFDWLDQGKGDGVFNRIAFRPMAEAQAREQEMTRDYFNRIAEAMRAVPEKTVRSWADKVTLDLIDPATGLPAVFTRQKIVAMALNWGNAGNRQRLSDGYGWNEAGIERALMENLTAEEWQFVQSVWDIIDTLWPAIEKMERAINGVAPEKVEAVEVVTPFGTLKGGYYPAIYDATLDYTAEEQAGRKADLFAANYTRATTRASATKDRAEKVSRPILLDLGVINRHLGEVIHDVTHREAVMRAHRFLTNRRVMRAVDETLGPEIRKQFRPWLQHIANSWAAERAGNEGIGKFLTKARANVTVVGMGWRFTTMLTQIAGYSNSMETVGAKWMTAAIAQSAAHPIETFNFAMERSDELRNRLDTLDRDIRLAIRQMAGKDSKITAAKRFAFHGIGYMDRVVSVPTWLAGYNKAIEAGMSEQDAAYAGDKAVRLSQGAGGAKDLAAVATGSGRYGEAFKLLTMFYSYLSTVYNRQRNLGRDVRRAEPSDLPGLIARAWWLIVVPPLLAEILSGRGPDDDEDWAWWAFSKMLAQSLGAIPIARDVVEPVYAKLTGQFSFGYRLSPVTAAGESIERVAGDVGKLAQGKETKRATRDVLEAVGYTTGLVPGQVAASTQFLVDVGMGEADPETIGDWYTGITKGRMPED